MWYIAIYLAMLVHSFETRYNTCGVNQQKIPSPGTETDTDGVQNGEHRREGE